jgi:uncharacterized membrane protein YciS (DUF1049 family)
MHTKRGKQQADLSFFVAKKSFFVYILCTVIFSYGFIVPFCVCSKYRETPIFQGFIGIGRNTTTL